MKQRRYWVESAAGILLTIFAVLCVGSIADKAATFDEVSHIPAAYSYLRTGELSINMEHPPLTKYVSAIPLLFFDLKDPRTLASFRGHDQYAFGREFLFESGQDADRIVFWARIPQIGFGVLLGMLIFVWVRQECGKLQALFALWLYVFCPQIIAYTRLVVPDIGVTFFIVLTAYFLSRYWKESRRGDLLLVGISLGLALLSKFSALVFIPLVGCVVACMKNPIKQRIKNVLILACVAFLVVWAGYGFDTGTILDPSREHHIFDRVFQGQSPARVKAIEFVAYKVPIPLPKFFSEIAYFKVHKSEGRDSYVLETHSRNGFWYGNTLGGFFKTPIPFLLLLTCAGVQILRKKRSFSWWIVTSMTGMVFLSDFLFKFATQTKYILPAWPLGIILVATTLDVKRISASGIGKVAGVLLLAWYAYAPLSVFPHALTYFNEFAGGEQKQHRVLVDSNLDWGQDIKLLARYLKENHIEKVKLAYFGMVPPEYYGVHYAPLAQFSEETGWVAVSATYLQGVHCPLEAFAWLRRYEPVARIGNSIFVYHF